ncbi:MAG TPA: methyltransferase domain-containing protein [Candidatus Limnocylindrales bacterium]|nr:methyltransferase domain-containing protein [Candidatus Limnocylindrales bacterium]
MFSHADAYDQFMGRYSSLLAAQMVDLAGVRAGQRVLDVGCGPGALTAELAARVGAGAVAAVDPSEPYVAAARTRVPGADVRVASAESLPFADRSFDAALAQLVVHFMRDPVDGIREMARVTKGGGVIAACVWDTAGASPITPFWNAAREIDPSVDDESRRPGVREGHLVELFAAAGLREITASSVVADLAHPTFESWWHPFELGVGPAGQFLARLDAGARGQLRERARSLLPAPPFTHHVRAWAARGLV